MKRLCALLLALVMVMSLAACAGKTAAPETQPAAKHDFGSAVTETKAPDTDVSKWPVIRCEVVPMADFSGEADVEAAMNEYLVSINAGLQVDLISLDFGERANVLTLMLADKSNPIDLYTWRWYSNVSSLVKNDQCISLEPYRDVYPEVFNMFPEGAYKACQVGGVQYSLPVSDTFCSFEYYAMRKDVAEEIGVMELVDTKITLEQLDEIMLKAKAAHPDMSWVNDLNAPTLQGIDNLGNDAAIGVLMNRGADATEVVNYYETAEWKTYIEMAKDWEAKGYFMDDPLNNPAIPGDLVKNGLMGGFFGEAATLTDAYTNVGMFVPGYDLVIFQLTDMGATNSCVGGGWQVSSICQNPDEAMKLLALMYTDETIARLFGNGVEGKQYKLDENGCAWYADGKDASNCGWHCTAPWFYPNKALVYPFETTDVNANKGDAACWNAEGMTFSKGMGFIFDDSAVRDEYAACASTVAEYRAALMYGQVDLEETNAQFVSELKENGIDDIIAEMNRQFTDFCNAG